MTRNLTQDFKNAITADHVPYLVFAELDFESGPLRVCNAGYNFTWDGKTWLGVGHLGRIDGIKEEASLTAHGIKLTISGIPTEHVSKALGEHYQGKSCKVWLAPLDPVTYQPVSNPHMIFDGLMDTMDPKIGKRATITVSAESILADWDRPRIRRYNHQDQIAEFPQDKGFQFVEKMADLTLIWGPK